MLIEVNDELVAKLALGINGGCSQFSFFPQERDKPPVIVEIAAVGQSSLRFRARQAGFERGDVTLSFAEIFENVPRITRLLKELEEGAASC